MRAFPERLERSLRSVRRQTGMETAYIARFDDDLMVFDYVDSDVRGGPFQAGHAVPLDGSYSKWIAEGRLPGILPDTRSVMVKQSAPLAGALPVGSILSVPIQLEGDDVYGCVGCVSGQPAQHLTPHDLGLMRVCSEFVGDLIERQRAAFDPVSLCFRRIQDILSANDGISIAYQPIINIADHRITGFEALARFPTDNRTPDLWFADAARAGLGAELELKAIEQALDGLTKLPCDAYVGVNASPTTVLDPRFYTLVSSYPLDRVMVEITEHEAIRHYGDIALALAPLRAKGLRLAVDDAGAGYASFRHVLGLEPDLIKLDRSVTQEIDTDPSRQALARAILGFTRETGCQLLAEGVERDSELATLRGIGLDKAQGFLIGRPEQIPERPKSKAASGMGM